MIGTYIQSIYKNANSVYNRDSDVFISDKKNPNIPMQIT